MGDSLADYDARLMELTRRAIDQHRIWSAKGGQWGPNDTASPWFFTEREMNALIAVRANIAKRNHKPEPKNWNEHRGPCPDTCICGGIHSANRWVCVSPTLPGGYTTEEMDAINSAR